MFSHIPHYNHLMSPRIRLRLIILGGVLIILASIGLTALAWGQTPRLLEISPANGAADVPAAAPLRLVFSAPMDADSVAKRLSIAPDRPGTFSWQGNTLTFSPNQPWPSGETVTVTLAGGARAGEFLSFGLAKQSWSFTTAQTLLAYLWPASGPADLYALDSLTGDIRRLTTDANILDYSFSTDGLVVYYSAINTQGGADLYALDRSSGAGAERLLACGQTACRSPVVSPDERFLAYESVPHITSSQVVQVWLFDLAAGTAAPLGDLAHANSQPRWSANGKLAYYDQTSQAYIIHDPQTGSFLSLPNQTGQGGSWSPDGRYFVAAEISFIRLDAMTDLGISRLLRYDSETGAAVNLTNASDVEDVTPVFSPDGGLIAFGRKYVDPERWTLGRPLWVMAADGSAVRPVMIDPLKVDYDFAWSLDGRQLAFVRFDQGAPTSPPELWLVNADGTNPLELVVGGYAPVWVP
jgi:Tol biopolymer transport system component